VLALVAATFDGAVPGDLAIPLHLLVAPHPEKP
jgi:hypothetical protein